MNKQMKNIMLVLIITLLLAACGGVGTTSAPEPAVVVSPTGTPEPVAISEPTKDLPTAVPSDGLAPESFSQYIGLSYPPLPVGLSQSFSMIIQDSNVYGLSLVLEGASKMLWLSKMSHSDSSGVAYWEVKDVLGLSNLEAGLTLLPDGCLLNDVPDGEIFVAGRNGAVIRAWRANMTLDKFEVIPTDGVRCNSDKAVSLE